jgi:hypothetical protein
VLASRHAVAICKNCPFQDVRTARQQTISMSSASGWDVSINSHGHSGVTAIAATGRSERRHRFLTSIGRHAEGHPVGRNPEPTRLGINARWVDRRMEQGRGGTCTTLVVFRPARLRRWSNHMVPRHRDVSLSRAVAVFWVGGSFNRLGGCCVWLLAWCDLDRLPRTMRGAKPPGDPSCRQTAGRELMRLPILRLGVVIDLGRLVCLLRGIAVASAVSRPCCSMVLWHGLLSQQWTIGRLRRSGGLDNARELPGTAFGD